MLSKARRGALQAVLRAVRKSRGGKVGGRSWRQRLILSGDDNVNHAESRQPRDDADGDSLTALAA
jgi:hypothetical protein